MASSPVDLTPVGSSPMDNLTTAGTMGASRPPLLPPCGYFDGETPAYQWCKHLINEFHEAGCPQDGSTAYRALNRIDIFCQGKAFKFLHQDREIFAIIVRAGEGHATWSDFMVVIKAMQDVFPVQFDDAIESAPHDELKRLKQRQDEPLMGYYSRTKSIMRQLDIKDQLPTGEALYSLQTWETSALNTVVVRFLGGLNDPLVKQEVGKRTLQPRTLWECLHVVTEAQGAIKDS